MSLRTQMPKDSRAVFLNPNAFAENVIYIPQSGGYKIIRAVVDRKGLDPGVENASRTLRKQAEVYIANSAADGISQVDKKDDLVLLVDIHGIIQTARIHEVLSKDEGMWHLLVGW